MDRSFLVFEDNIPQYGKKICNVFCFVVITVFSIYWMCKEAFEWWPCSAEGLDFSFLFYLAFLFITAYMCLILLQFGSSQNRWHTRKYDWKSEKMKHSFVKVCNENRNLRKIPWTTSVIMPDHYSNDISNKVITCQYKSFLTGSLEFRIMFVMETSSYGVPIHTCI